MREPIGVPVIRWRCAVDGCRKSFADRSSARKHAAICPWDPDNRSCLTCVNYFPGDSEDSRGCDLGLNAEPPLPRQCPSWAALSPNPEEGSL